MFPFSTKHYVFDYETAGLDGHSCVFVSERVLRPSIQFRPFKISWWKTINVRELSEYNK